jgi:hypothetical protein
MFPVWCNAIHDVNVTIVAAPAEPRLHGPSVLASTLVNVRMTTFWDRMRAFFGENYADSVAKDQVIGDLGDRTVNKALADGIDAKTVWRAVCDTFNVPDSLR